MMQIEVTVASKEAFHTSAGSEAVALSESKSKGIHNFNARFLLIILITSKSCTLHFHMRMSHATLF